MPFCFFKLGIDKQKYPVVKQRFDKKNYGNIGKGQDFVSSETTVYKNQIRSPHGTTYHRDNTCDLLGTRMIDEGRLKNHIPETQVTFQIAVFFLISNLLCIHIMFYGGDIVPDLRGPVLRSGAFTLTTYGNGFNNIW